jgi:enoyl-CoA hydratase/carnithine racemase
MEQATEALAFENLLYEKKGDLAYVTINRPKVLNALNQATFSEMGAAFAEAGGDPAVKGVILTGAGDKAFIAGADISELARATAVEALEAARHGQYVLNVIEDLGKPVIAAINGFALGGGCETAMACTIRLAVEEARFGQPEVKLGLLPGGGGTQRLPRLVGKGLALQVIRRDHLGAGSLPDRAGQRDRAQGPADPARRRDPSADRRQRTLDGSD